jgi:hypothetical protein
MSIDIINVRYWHLADSFRRRTECLHDLGNHHRRTNGNNSPCFALVSLVCVSKKHVGMAKIFYRVRVHEPSPLEYRCSERRLAQASSANLERKRRTIRQKDWHH